MEERLLERINKLGIGPPGSGGTVTALAVSILPAATHIAQLPICVNLCCHVCRQRFRFFIKSLAKNSNALHGLVFV